MDSIPFHLYCRSRNRSPLSRLCRLLNGQAASRSAAAAGAEGGVGLGGRRRRPDDDAVACACASLVGAAEKSISAPPISDENAAATIVPPIPALDGGRQAETRLTQTCHSTRPASVGYRPRLEWTRGPDQLKTRSRPDPDPAKRGAWRSGRVLTKPTNKAGGKSVPGLSEARQVWLTTILRIGTRGKNRPTPHTYNSLCLPLSKLLCRWQEFQFAVQIQKKQRSS